ncbi:hypothetical protein [Candidatus Poriferisodalis sp.]|uniref:hypothetical protein n=1 Tax=Candidatus Poriferisodalis sp. TaxID=3101277 RepID=UPI003B5CF08B
MAVIEYATLEDLERSVNGLKPEVERYVADAVRVLRGEIAGTVGAAEARLTHRIDGVETKVDRIESKVDGIESRVDGIESRVDGVETKIDRIESKVDGIESRVDGVETKIDRIESKIDRLVEVPPD